MDEQGKVLAEVPESSLLIDGLVKLYLDGMRVVSQ